MERKIKLGTIEKRTVATTELRAESQGDEMALVGYAAIFNSRSKDVGGFFEICAPGCFSRSLKEGADVKALVNHEASQLLGRVQNGTLTLAQDDRGLKFRVALNPKSQAHRDLHSSIERGDMNECSFAFTIPNGGDTWEERTENGQLVIVRTLRDVNLLDVSAVTYPAYNATSVGARSVDYGTLPESREALLAKAMALPGDWKRQERAAELGQAIMRDLYSNDQYEEQEEDEPDDRDIQDFLSSRFGRSKFGHGSRYLLTNKEISSKEEDGSGSGIAVCMDCNGASSTARVKIRFAFDPFGKVTFDDPEEI